MREVETMSGAIIIYEESGTETLRGHRHNGYSSGFSPSRDPWESHGWDTRPTGNRPVSASASPPATRD
jgi:hypothetical protein